MIPYVLRPLKNAYFCPISASDSNFNPRNTKCIPVVKIFVFLDLEQNGTFFKGLKINTGYLIKRDYREKGLLPNRGSHRH